MKRTKKDESLRPIFVREGNWMYAEKRSLCVVYECRVGQMHNVVLYIPWRKIELALKLANPHHQRKARR